MPRPKPSDLPAPRPSLFRLRPRSAVSLVGADDGPTSGFVERLRQLARQVLDDEA